jgi:hypothetical protein
MKRTFFYFLCISILQIGSMIFIYELALNSNPLAKSDVSFGIYIYYLVWFYSALVLVSNLLLFFTGLRWSSVLLILFLVVGFDIYCLSPHESYPNRSMFNLYLTNGLLSLSFVLAYFAKPSNKLMKDDNILDQN